MPASIWAEEKSGQRCVFVDVWLRIFLCAQPEKLSQEEGEGGRLSKLSSSMQYGTEQQNRKIWIALTKKCCGH